MTERKYTRRPRVIVRQSAGPVRRPVAHVLCFNVDGERYDLAAEWGFDALGSGDGLRLDTARAASWWTTYNGRCPGAVLACGGVAL